MASRRVISASDITAALRELGVEAQDALFVHSGLQTSLRVEGRSPADKVRTIVEGLREAVADGELIVPTFTYSFTEGRDFDVARTPSAVGALGEEFRSMPGVRRTPEPIFSTAIDGRLPRDWDERLFALEDKSCFGPESVFAYLRERRGKLLFYGVGFEFCTFIHHVEQRLGVPYRYLKDFSGAVTDGDRSRRITARYFVRDVEADVESYFDPLDEELRRRGLAHATTIPRGPSLLVVGADAVEAVATEKVEENRAYLLRRGHPEAATTETARLP
jgi:aminoglycoside 3-N-acetyltransferase